MTHCVMKDIRFIISAKPMLKAKAQIEKNLRAKIEDLTCIGISRNLNEPLCLNIQLKLERHFR